MHGEKDIVVTSGIESAETQLPVTDKTMFMIGSTTKVFAATAAMALVEDGLLDLDTPLVEYIPELAFADEEATRTVTMRHLLTHAGGFTGDASLSAGWGDDALGRAMARLSELQQEFPVGEVFSYSNSGFALAGHVVAKISSLTFEEFVTQRILAPLHMKNSAFLPWDVMTRRFALGHYLRDGVPFVSNETGTDRGMTPCGGMWSSVRDQLVWARYALSGAHPGEGQPLDESTRLLMQKPQLPAAMMFEEVGLGWLLTRYGTTQVVRHGGHVSNLQVSEFMTVPEKNFAVTVLTNALGGGIGKKVVDWCMANLAELPDPASLDVVEPEPSAVDAVLGKYQAGDLTMTVAPGDEGIGVRMGSAQDLGDYEDIVWPPAIPIAFVNALDFAARADNSRTLGRFVTDETGRAVMLEFGGRTAKRVA
ncbi:serine hydrolase [Rhodococcus erythropolis]|uniref:serine hydrolase domain-containing protein n=1 Tax=Rhodococcus erythropolis TaxID=1833 RepID=UPI001E2D5B86|nr:MULTISPECIES: serine hydrolase domain-containing protein [Rhodococcus erythropolis group]MCD2109293.1 beta-lactamase family protein [Rhodococcus qingshengii]MCZ4528217.1 serine hydrolase [Rhodococcus erythropolis]